MPLTADIDGVRAKITASVSSVEATVEAQANSVKAGVSGRLIPTAQFVPLRLGGFRESDGFTKNGLLYVDDGKNSYRLGLDTLKKMNTKIAYTDDLANVDMTKLVKGDYICLQK